MTASEVRTKLLAAGYKAEQNGSGQSQNLNAQSCWFSRNATYDRPFANWVGVPQHPAQEGWGNGKTGTMVSFSTSVSPGTCDETGTVYSFTYAYATPPFQGTIVDLAVALNEKFGSRVPNEQAADELARNLDRLFGEPSACQPVPPGINAVASHCAWNYPVKYLPTASFELSTGAFTLLMSAKAVPHLDRQPTLASIAQQFDPRRPFNDLDLTAPGGFRIGMPLSEGVAALYAAGFRVVDYGSCRVNGQLTRTMEMQFDVVLIGGPKGNFGACSANAVIDSVRYQRLVSRPKDFGEAIAPAELARRASASFGTPDPPKAGGNKCSEQKTEGGTVTRSVACAWTAPSAATTLKSASLQYTITEQPRKEMQVTVELAAK